MDRSRTKLLLTFRPYRLFKFKSLLGILVVLFLTWPAFLGHAQSILELQAQIETLLAQVQALQQQLAAVSVQTTSTICQFNRDLFVGLSGEDAACLQRYLNNFGFVLAGFGPGSPGNETTYFGALTREAVARWQEENGVFPAAGYFGPLSRAIYIQLTAPNTQTAQPTQTSQPPTTTYPTPVQSTTQPTTPTETTSQPTQTTATPTQTAPVPDTGTTATPTEQQPIGTTTPTSPSTQTVKPSGIADLHNVGAAVDQTVLAKPYVDYNITRVRWGHLEPTNNLYDFSYIRSGLEASRVAGTKFVLRIIGGRGSPDWIKNNPAIPTVTYTRTKQDGSTSTEIVPAPWNAIYKEEFKELIQKLSGEFGNQLTAISICGMDQACGIGLGPDRTYDKWVAIGYSPTVYLETIKWFIDLYNQSFPSAFLIFHTGKPFGDLSVLTGSVDYGKTAVGKARFGLFAENLKASFENDPNPESKRQIMIDYAREAGWIGYQSVWSVTDDPLNANDCLTYESDSDCLWRAVNAGIADGARYFELYEEDIRALSSTIQKISDTLKSLP